MSDVNLEDSKGTISISLVHEALCSAQQRGLNIEAMLLKAGITLELLHSAKARVSISQYAQLWVEIADVMNDEFFGMDSHAMRRGSFKLLSQSVMQAETLKKHYSIFYNF